VLILRGVVRATPRQQQQYNSFEDDDGFSDDDDDDEEEEDLAETTRAFSPFRNSPVADTVTFGDDGN